MSFLSKWFRRSSGATRTADPVAAAAPQRRDAAAPPASPVKHAYALVACARWEEASIQEWIEYHKSIGFSHVYLYSNDDDPTLLFRAVAPYTYGPDPFVTFLHWPVVGQQNEIYLHFLKTFKQETAWYSLLDIDEFFVLKGVDNIADFMRDHEAQVDCLYFNWVLFGNNGRVRRTEGSTLTSYPRRMRAPDSHTKMLCRSAAMDVAAIEKGNSVRRGTFHHFLDNFNLPGVRCRDVLGGSTEGYSANFNASAEPFIKRDGFAEGVLQRGYIAHYQFRSEEDFIRRWRRGGFGQDEMWRRFYETGAHKGVLAARNQVYDTYLAEYWLRHTANTMRVGISRPEIAALGENVALNRPSWQSSEFVPEGPVAAFSHTAGSGNNGVRTGTYGFHTNIEKRPWWIVDLLKPHRIAAIHVYNRRDDQAVNTRANELDVLASVDGVSWNTLLSNPANAPFGFDGSPLVAAAPAYLACRFVLLRLRGTNYLHLDEVEVYGSVVVPTVPVVVPEGGPVIPQD
jgi:hypothetical protein